jgi:FMN-dependent NADH-azoreductase
MLGAKHIHYYMEQHGNLYKYSQQGWESLNEKIKPSFFNHTQRGGNFGRGGIESERAYLKSIFMFFQHEILWISGAAEEYFHSKYY